MTLKNLDYVSTTLLIAIESYINRIDASQRDRELIYDIIGFAFEEGRIQGIEETLHGGTLQKTKNGEE